MTDAPTQPRWIEYHRLDEIVGFAGNVKGHDLDLLATSFARWGYTEPIMVDERTGILVAGHGRTERLRLDHAAGQDPPDGVTVDADGMWLAPVVHGWHSANDDEAEAYTVAANQLTIAGGWLDDPLVSLLQRVSTNTDLGLAGVGFSDRELGDMVERLGAVPTIDELQQQHGEPTPEDFWPTLRFKVSPDLKQRYLVLCEPVGSNDSEHFAYLVELAEKAKANEE